MIRSPYRAPDGRLHIGLTPGEFAAAVQTPDGLLWVDLEDEPPSNCEPILRETFGFHPLAIDDALQEIHVPVVKTLTLITTLFMPLSFVVGFFGMNFFQAVAPLGVWTGKTAFTLTLALLALTPVAMYFWMRRRAWM